MEGADHMNHHRKSAVSHQRRSLQKIRYPRFRYSIVGLLPTAQENKPMILLSGDWLREFGFGFNQRLRVVPSQGKIVIESLLSESKFSLCTTRPPTSSSHAATETIVDDARLHAGSPRQHKTIALD